jgi:hypothetical protein
VLKLGTAAAWFTALASAETLPLEDVPGAELDPEEPELVVELLDEHAATVIAAAVIASADAARRTCL